MSIRLFKFTPLLLLLAGCSNNFQPLSGTAVNDTPPEPPAPPNRVLVVGDAHSPKLADFLTTKGLDVLDVPYSRFAASDDLKMAGDYIVWSDNRNGDLDIYAYQISTNTEFVVAKAAGKQWQPDIAGDYIVWEDYRNGNADIYGYQISTATEFAIATSAQNQLLPRTDGVNVVWQDLRNGNADIYRFTLSGAGGSEAPVYVGAGDQWYPQVSGDFITWQSYVNGYSDVYLYQISSNLTTNLTNAPSSSQYQPQIDGDYVVWVDNSSGDDDIRGYQISTATPLAVAVQTGQQRNPRVSANHVVWQDNRDGNFDIFSYELPSGPETRLTSDIADQTLPQIAGDLVAWEDLRNGNYDIYAYTFSGAAEQRVSRDTTDQTHPHIANGRLAWLDQSRGVVDVVWSEDMGSTLNLATNTWLTPAGMIGDISSYQVVVFANDFVSQPVMLNLYDSAIAAGIGVVGLGGDGSSLARTLSEATPRRYGITIKASRGCSPMEISATVPSDTVHPLYYGINVGNLVELETYDAATRDELVIRTDSTALDSPQSWIVRAIFSSAMCNSGGDALIEYTDGKSKVVLDGTATMADGYIYWSGDRWDLFINEVNYVVPPK